VHDLTFDHDRGCRTDTRTSYLLGVLDFDDLNIHAQLKRCTLDDSDRAAALAAA
jgi:hypothetical protein